VLWRTPGDFRGKAVRVNGTLVRLAPYPLKDGDVAGRTVLYEGQLTDDRNALYSFILLENPGPAKRGDRVALNGLFFKLWSYVNQREDDVTTREREDITHTPLLLGRTMTVYPAPAAGKPPVPGPGSRLFVIATCGAFVLGGAVLVWAVRRERRKSAALARERVERRRGRRGEPGDVAARGPVTETHS
jgi:hypothetical protein